MGYQNVKNSRQRLKERLVYIFGEKCCICGYNKCINALEFHHLNPEEKDFTIATNVNIATEKAIEEIKKCILVCANCHREIHAELIPLNDAISTFSINKATEVLETLNNIKTKTHYYCQDCGAEIVESDAQRCRQCASIALRKADRPTREELKEKIRTIPFTTIAKAYGVTDNAVRKWCDGYNLPRKVSEIKTFTDEEWQQI